MRKLLVFWALSLSVHLVARDDVVQLNVYEVDGNAPIAVVQRVPEIPDSIVGKSGEVILEYRINKSGKVQNIKVLTSTDRALTRFSKNMVKKWRYESRMSNAIARQPIIFVVKSRSLPTQVATN